MLQTKDMGSDERLKHAKSLFDASVKLLEDRRALDKKRKRRESGTSMTSTISSISSTTKAFSPPNKKRRGNSEALQYDSNLENHAINTASSSLGENSEQTSLNTSLPLKKRGKFYNYIFLAHKIIHKIIWY